jgi:hypothetical protein
MMSCRLAHRQGSAAMKPVIVALAVVGLAFFAGQAAGQPGSAER